MNLRQIALGAADGTLSDVFLVDWLRDVYENPLTLDQTAELTIAMADSGDRLDLTGLPKPWLDKHSTGGIGDKTTIAILPLLASCGLTMVKMSGRGLGLTGGTIDKLESVGMDTDMTPAEMIAQAKRIGIALSGQNTDLAPADGRIYALRNDHGFVDSIPLIVSSVLSKKLAGGCDTVMLDVKCGLGAFMETYAEASQLKDWLEQVGERIGLGVHALVTDMHQPLGATVGNAIEVAEAREVLIGQRLTPNTERFRRFVVMMAEHALSAVGFDPSLAEERLKDGSAAAKAREWFAAQGCDFDAKTKGGTGTPIKADQNGWVSHIDARQIGEIALDLGAGRRAKTDLIEGAAGVIVPLPIGSPVRKGEMIGCVTGWDMEARERAVERLASAIEISPSQVPEIPLVLTN